MTIELNIKEDYDFSTNEVSFREILKFVNEELNKNNYFILELDGKKIYLKWKADNKLFATVYIDKIIECIQYIKEEKK